jgi:hypothetical protein
MTSTEAMGRIAALKSDMGWETFENGRPYSFSYYTKPLFEDITSSFETLPRKVSNALPVFLPEGVRRIAFSEWASKSVRRVEVSGLEDILVRNAERMARDGVIDPGDVPKFVSEDMAAFLLYDKAHPATEYRTDVLSTAVQFRAYGEDDEMLIDNAFVRGGLVFPFGPDVFGEIEVTYPRRRKRRSDRRNDYLGLKLLKIRPVQ